MGEPRRHLDERRLLGVARAAFDGREPTSVERLRGGTTKGVYRLVLRDGTTGVVYVWNAEEDYWSGAGEPADGPFGHATGLGLFSAAHATLSRLGVRVPELILLDGSGSLVDGDLAVVEDVPGPSLEDLMARDPRRAEPVLARLGDAVRAMHGHHADRYGRPGADDPLVPAAQRRRAGDGPAAETIVLRRALGHLRRCAERVERIAAVEHRLADTLRRRHAEVRPRTTYGLIHGELGPDHVLVDDQDRPVLVDLEGVVFFDVEWEHAFLEVRFGDGYHHFAAGGLDHRRLRLYRLALYLSLVEGPLRLLDGDFPDRAEMREIADRNTDRTLAELS